MHLFADLKDFPGLAVHNQTLKALENAAMKLQDFPRFVEPV